METPLCRVDKLAVGKAGYYDNLPETLENPGTAGKDIVHLFTSLLPEKNDVK
jgi:hypothetical protein